MAVPGRKEADMPRPEVASSEDNFGYKCQPCLSIGQHVEANGFCVACQEYLCKTCLEYHKRTKALRNHQTLRRNEFNELTTAMKPNNECIEQCPVHQNEIIKFYCPMHATLGCNDCMTIGHRTCDIVYIPDKCVDIAEGQEYDFIMMKLSAKLQEAEEVSKKAESRRTEIMATNAKVLKKIIEFQDEINDRLDRMKKDIIDNAEDKKSTSKRKVQTVLDTCGNITSEMQKLQSSLRANKSNNQNGQLYIDIKRAWAELKSDKLNEAKEVLLNMNIHFWFCRSSDLEKLLSNELTFGQLVDCNRPESEKIRVNTTVDYLTLKSKINIRTKSDQTECVITGCTVLPPYKLILADNTNKKVKIVSVVSKLVVQEKSLDSRPDDIAMMSPNLFAVTMLDKGSLYVMTTDDKLSHVRTIKVGASCCGIAFHDNIFYAACLFPSCVVVLSTQGNVLRNIPLHFLSFSCNPYIAVRKDSILLYINDKYNDSLVSVSLLDDVSTTYKHEDLQGPSGMCILDDGSLLVCCCDNGTVHKVNSDFMEGRPIYDMVTSPVSICYNAQREETYVSCSSGNYVTVLSSK